MTCRDIPETDRNTSRMAKGDEIGERTHPASASRRVAHVERAEHSADQTSEAVENEIPHRVIERRLERGALGALRKQRIRQVLEDLPEGSNAERR